MKTLAEIAIEAGLITRTNAAKAGRMADERKQALVSILVRDLGVDEVALVGALRKQTRVPLIDPADVQVDPEAMNLVSRDVCSRLRVLPLTVTTDSSGKVLRIAMADPTDTAAIAEIEQLTQCEIELTALPLSAIEELVDKGYRQLNTAITRSPGPRLTARKAAVVERESETSVTAQIPLSSMVPPRDAAGDDVELRLTALVEILMVKGVITEEELAEALRKRGV